MKIFNPIVLEAIKLTNNWKVWNYAFCVLGAERPYMRNGLDFSFNGKNYQIIIWSNNKIIIQYFNTNKILFKLNK